MVLEDIENEIKAIKNENMKLKAVAEDYRLLREENDRLMERLSIYER